MVKISLIILGSIATIFVSIVIAGRLGIGKEKEAALGKIDSWVEVTRKKCSSKTSKEELDHCFRVMLRQAVARQGTSRAVEILVALRESGIIDATFDDHQHVHEIGRETAKLKGLTTDAFFSCPTTFNFGCMHGFFENALTQTSSYQEAMTKICESIGADQPTKLYSYCYHGAGHGLMMALSYSLEKSLSICDLLPNKTAQEGCWQGVLMENGNAAVTDSEKVLGFSLEDPLSPCNKLDKKYQWQCYINHAGYLMKVTNLNLKKAADICLSAPDAGAVACIQSIGLMVTNPIWQKSMRGVDTARDKKMNVTISWQMCQELPTKATRDCVIGAIGNILNFDETDISRAEMFCRLVNPTYQDTCFTQIGASIASQVTKREQARLICKTLTGESQTSCLRGVGGNQENDEALINDDVLLKAYIKNYGPGAVIEKFAEIMPARGLSCHDRAHETGRFAYEHMGVEAFKSCRSQCHSGCYHGAAEAFFHDKGTANLQENLAKLCPTEANRFFSHQCIHGVGHGLMAWSGYELFEALESCNLLSGSDAQSSCWTGVFMENIVGGLASDTAAGDFSSDRHFTKYLNSDPHYPCNAVEETYKGSCYFLQTSRMLQLFRSDFQKIARACMGAPLRWRISCFQSMGRDVGGTSKHNVQLAIAKCENAPAGEYRQECLSGAVQDTFWDASGQEEAKNFCALLTNEAQARRCWQTITVRAREVLSQADYATFCQTLPEAARGLCRQELVTEKNKEYGYFNDFISYLSRIWKQISSYIETNSVIAKEGKVHIVINSSGYIPKRVTLKRGTRVTFVNQVQEARWPASNIHPTHRIYAEFDPQKPVKPGESWQFTFDKIGIWHFHDHIEPSFRGTIIVAE